eukprot:CAMPEP_0201593372 /NCGR_PEP_ID=MMETSP0190_2-20130828/190990_1 /ASSEMBLY_ACC=CAM_ASM_000263 /TAXON_ID=37353 /ORGANISM="Rosalina sp." /LENGTH=747 /DNA_ID=CAMNT_0048052525 /DNA_START=91 /DNA_END=2335 /DNA_ORIENTATION=+
MSHSQKLVVEVSGLDKSGSLSVQAIKLPTKNDWNKNLNALNKKIAKKFKTDKEYGLSINGLNIRCDDVQALTNAMQSFDFNNTPQFSIVNATDNGEGDGRKIVIHFDNATYVSTIKQELSELDEDVYDGLLARAKSHFKIMGSLGRLYENVGGKPNYIDDWDDLSECLEEIEIGESVDLYLENNAQPGAHKASSKQPVMNNPNDEEDEKKQYVPDIPLNQGSEDESVDLYLENNAQPGAHKVSSKRPAINNPNDEEDEKKQYAPDIPQQSRYRGPKKQVSLVFVGETGVGKTTLLTSLNDFINHVSYEQVRTTKKPELVGLSQTQHTEQFPLSNEEWAVNIIDTPGIGDTNGAERDEQHMGGIIDFLGNYGDFNAVCILIKRGTTRLTTRMRYIVNELRSNMPKDVQNNFIVIMTRSDVPVPDKDTMAVIEQLNLPTGNIIPVNNGAYEELDLSKYPKGSPIIKIVKQRQKQDYDSNHQYLQILLETAVAMQPYQGNKMSELKQKRDKLKEQVGILKKTIDSSFATETEIKEQLAAFSAATTIEQMNKAFDQSKNHVEYEWYKASGSITTHCNACSKSCHIDCGLNYGHNLTSCAASGTGGICRQCGCSMSIHCHMGWKQKSKTVWVTNVNQKMKVEFMDAQQKKKAIEKRKRELKTKLTKLEKKRDRCAEDIRQKYAELEKIAIIGYNESFELYMKECKKAVEKDEKLTKEQKEAKIGVFDGALQQFKIFKDAIKGNIKKAVDYIF